MGYCLHLTMVLWYTQDTRKVWCGGELLPSLVTAVTSWCHKMVVPGWPSARRTAPGAARLPSARVGSLPLPCPGVWCPPLETPAHGFTVGSAHQFGDTVRFFCQQGRRLFGSAEVVCNASGAWSAPPPVCHRVWCQAPVLGPEFRPAEHRTFPHLTAVSLECRNGHTARGLLNITCQANGRWSRPEGACQSKTPATILTRSPRSVLRETQDGGGSHPSLSYLCIWLQGAIFMPLR